jgi:transposase
LALFAAAAGSSSVFGRALSSQSGDRFDGDAWTQWLKTAKETPLASFAAHLQRDQAAILAAMQLPWSNGHVEGQVHRLKLIKRQM